MPTKPHGSAARPLAPCLKNPSQARTILQAALAVKSLKPYTRMMIGACNVAEKKYISIEALQQQLAVSQRHKRWYLAAAVAFALLLGMVLFSIYSARVLDYAQIEQVEISQDGSSNRISYRFHVTHGGRLDYHYGALVMTERVTSGSNGAFSWNWEGSGETIMSIRSRSGPFPRWHKKTVQLSGSPE